MWLCSAQLVSSSNKTPDSVNLPAKLPIVVYFLLQITISGFIIQYISIREHTKFYQKFYQKFYGSNPNFYAKFEVGGKIMQVLL